MKTQTKIKIMRLMLGIVVMTLTIASFAGGTLWGILGVTTPGLMLGVGAVAAQILEGETPTTETNTGTLLMPEISKKITEIKPASTPLDTILRNLSLIVPVGAWETQWYQVDTRGINDVLAVGFNTSASGTYDSTSGIHILTVTNAHIWSVDDNVLVQNVAGGGTDGGDLVVHIVSKNVAAKTLGVVPVNGFGAQGKDLPDIPIDTKLVRIGNAKNELDAQTAPYTVYPEKEYNYCQIHMAQIEQGIYDKLHNKEVNWDITDFRAQSMYDMRRGMELASLFGARGHILDPEGNDMKYMSAGITRYITKKLGYLPNLIDNTTFLDWNEQIFVGNSGSDTRVCFAGKTLIKRIAGVDFVNKQIEAKSTEVVFGIKFNRIESNFGVLLWKHHNLFNDCGWEEKGLVLDINNIERHVFKAMAVEQLELKKSGQRLADAYRIDEAFCLATRYPDTHAIIAPTAASGSGSV